MQNRTAGESGDIKEMLVKLFRIIYKFFFSLIILLFFVATTSVVFLLPVNSVRRRKNLMAVTGFYDRFYLALLGVRITYKGLENYDREKTYYVMGNHMTFVDIFAVVSLFRVLFITSNELKKRPVMGQVAYFAGCLFVERRKITTLKDEIPRIGEVLKSGLSICLFPEATCSDGRGLLPFKGGLLEAVQGTGVEALPVIITYRKINGKNIRRSDYARFGYFGGMKFVPQYLKLLMFKSLSLQMEVLPPVPTEGRERKEIRDQLSEVMNARYSEYLEGVEE